MKIAAVSDDGVTISQHFGHALLYMVIKDDAVQAYLKCKLEYHPERLH